MQEINNDLLLKLKKMLQMLRDFFIKKELKSPHKRTRDIEQEAKELGVHPDDLKTETGSIERDYYPILLRIQTEKSFRMLSSTQKWAALSCIAAIISAFAAIYIAVIESNEPNTLIIQKYYLVPSFMKPS